MSGQRAAPTTGFTLVETIVVLVILGILALVAIPRFFARADFDALAFYDRSLAAVRYAQKVAIAQRRLVFVVPTATTVSVCFDSAACSTPVIDPSSGSALAVSAPAGLSVSSSAGNISFNGLGQPSAGTTFTISGTPARTFTVEQETGYVHP